MTGESRYARTMTLVSATNLGGRLAARRKVELDAFRFTKVLGQGSFGKFLLAEVNGSDEQVAIKILKKEEVLKSPHFCLMSIVPYINSRRHSPYTEISYKGSLSFRLIYCIQNEFICNAAFYILKEGKENMRILSFNILFWMFLMNHSYETY